MDRSSLSQGFHLIKYVCGFVSAVLLVWLSCHLFIRGIGGPFPQRTRGPFANHKYYQLAEFESWEDFLNVPGQDKTLAEMLIEDQAIPPLTYSKPDALPPIKTPTPLPPPR